MKNKIEMNLPNLEIVRPFFRWVGGKQNIVSNLVQNLPDNIQNRRYYEPFLGAASMFLAISPKHAILSDSNKQLINTFRVVKKWPSEFYKLLETHGKYLTEHKYYKIRQAFNSAKEKDIILQAVRFVFLIQTSFNGI